MKKNYYSICQTCGRTIEKHDIDTHAKECQEMARSNVAFVEQREIHLCRFCSKPFSRVRALQAHEMCCRLNPLYEERKRKQSEGLKNALKDGWSDEKRKSISRSSAITSVEQHEMRNGRKDYELPMDGVEVT